MNMNNLIFYQFDYYRGLIYIGNSPANSPSNNVTQYTINTTFDSTRNQTNVTWAFETNWTTNTTYERFDFKNKPIILFSNSITNNNQGQISIYNISTDHMMLIDQINGNISINNTLFNTTMTMVG